ncbi:MAG: hypothetical protein ACREK3_00370 [Gemmatimonadota bacterium]
MTILRFDVGFLVAFLCFTVLSAAPVHGQGAAASGAEVEVNEEGFPVPSLEGFHELPENRRTQDTNAYIAGEETVFEVREGSDGTGVASATTGDVLWGYGIFPQGDMARGYFLRDPDCDGRMTEKLPLNAQFSPPDCAQASVPQIILADFAPEEIAVITDVSLSGYAAEPPKHSDGRYILDPARIGTEFSADTRSVLLWFRWDGAGPGTTPATVHWYLNCELGLEQDAPLDSEAGSRIILLGGGSDPLPTGGYRVEILEDGTRVATIPFTIGTPEIPAGLDTGSPDCVLEGG